jgi:CheY-like chemotaxis protein
MGGIRRASCSLKRFKTSYIYYRKPTVSGHRLVSFLHQRRTAIGRSYWLSREKAEIKMAYLAESISSRRLHLDLAARLSLKAETLHRFVREPTMRLLRPLSDAVPRFGRSPAKVKPMVLICDREELILDLLEHHLAGAGYMVMRAPDGATAMELLADHVPAVAILAIDIGIPSGTEVLQRIRENPRLRKVPVIMLTDRNSEADVVGALRLGASEYMTKPFMIAEVLERVSKSIYPYEHPLESVLQELAA